MKTLNRSLALLFLIMMANQHYAQQQSDRGHSCGFENSMRLNMQLDPGFVDRMKAKVRSSGKYANNNTVNASPGTPFVIPVVFHVIQDANTPTHIPSYTEIQWQLASLNAAFSNNQASLNNVANGPWGADTYIRFCFAKFTQAGGGPSPWPNSTPGMINYTTNDPQITSFDAGNSSASYAATAGLINYASDFPGNMYLNIVCVPNMANGPGGSVTDPPSVIGVGMFPGSILPLDGIVMRNDCIGNNTYGQFTGMFAPLDKGNILAHEAGHYLGLFHTFETLSGGPNISTLGGPPGCFGMTAGTANDEGDLIYDTPPTTNNSQTPIGFNTCHENYQPYGTGALDQPDQLENYMTYSDDDIMNTFTHNQGQRMWGALDASYSTHFLSGQRSNLWTNANLIATGVNTTPSCGPGLLTAAFLYTVNTGAATCTTVPLSFQVPILNNYISTISYTWNFGDGHTSNAVNPTHTYTILPTDYTVTLTASDGVSTVTHTMAISVPESVPRIVGQSGATITVCKGTEQTILIKFPRTHTMVVITDGTTTYTVASNYFHTCTSPAGVYTFPFTFTVTNSGTWTIVSPYCIPSSATFTVVDCCGNLVNNGDFESGPTGFYSDYILSSTTGASGFAMVNTLPGYAGNVLYIDSYMWNSFGNPIQCNSPGAQKILVGQILSGLQANKQYYVAFRSIQAHDSVNSCGPQKYNLRVFDGGTSYINKNIAPSTIPDLTCAGAISGQNPYANQVFGFTFTTPGVISSPISIELKEVDRSHPFAFDYIIDNLVVQEILPPGVLSVPLVSVINPTPLCWPATYTLNASGVSPVVWQPGNITTPSFTVRPVSPVTYTAYGGVCGLGSTITVIPEPQLDVYAYDAVHCLNSPTPGAVISATVYPFGTPATYSWEPGGLVGQTQTVTPAVSTIYTVYITTSNGCTINWLVGVETTSNCCPQALPVLSQTTISSSLTGPYVVLHDLVIDVGVVPPPYSVLLSGEFLMAPGVKITVAPNNEFRFTGHMYACGTNMWEGIKVSNGGGFVSNGSLIEDAITAVDASNISPGYYIPPIEIDNTVLNKNYININLSNSSGITQLPIRVINSVFTSRDLPFTATTWPGAGISPGELRYASTPTTDLAPPYQLQGYAFSNLKLPYNTQPSHIGLKITNIGQVMGGAVYPGVVMGDANFASGFNLFDNIGTAIDVTNSSLTTFNNVFQNSARYLVNSVMTGGTAIRHTITSLMNAGLFLSSPSGDKFFSNRFWNNYTGIDATNVYMLEADNLIMRSTQNQTGYTGNLFAHGNKGIQLTTNRFYYSINFGDFNNIRDAINLDVVSGNWDLGSGTFSGGYGGNINIEQNYFGAQVASSAPLSNLEYMRSAVTLNSPFISGYAANGLISVSSNKINRSYNGISVDGLNGQKTRISGNSIELVDDPVTNTQQGIRLLNTLGRLESYRNTITAPGTSNTGLSAFFCGNNSGSNSPDILCNQVQDTYTGFNFSGANNSTIWKGNEMSDHYYGLLLTNNGVIGQQGSPGNPSDNKWSGGTWAGPPYETYTDASDAALSVLFVQPTGGYNPFFNGTNVLFQDYGQPGNLIFTGGSFNCPGPLPPPPSYRTDNSTGIGGTDAEIRIFPNPASDRVSIGSAKENDRLHVRIMDIAGKIIVDKTIEIKNSVATFDFDVENGIYLFEITNGEGNTTTRKLIVAR